ncbi:target of rapamycin complex 2 subunit MAPKAP1-like [Micropterus dolomieu]|uniref:target of rapamycin complex 2 subunit MAPKAP1-like n=1 Tax=Micropterus dolomieu TaxID=147949 RepID=UPI001E8EE8EE|nr:target of rapamycin complex 2 subunit MAPKAP1-like [Micropterus dolomieu]
MAFLDNPAIILAHIRQSHVTSDDTGMCEMVLIDQDVDLEKCQLALVPGSSCGSTESGSMSEGGSSVTDSHACDLSQSMDITSSWDFGIRRRSNTAQRLERLRKERQNQIKCKNIQWKERTSSQSVEDLGTLFEKRDFKDRPRTAGTKSTLSLRLEQCPQQLNNPFNEYSKFDGKNCNLPGVPRSTRCSVLRDMAKTDQMDGPVAGSVMGTELHFDSEDSKVEVG